MTKEKTFRNFVNSISYYKDLLKPQYKKYYDDITKLYIDRKIEKKSQVEKLLNKLVSGRGIAKTNAIKQIDAFNKKQSVKGLIKGEQKYEYHLSATIDSKIFYKNKSKYKESFKESRIYYGYSKDVIKQYEEDLRDEYNYENSISISEVAKIDISILRDQPSQKKIKLEHVRMFSSEVINYDFIPEFKTYCEEGIKDECVINNFIGMYPELKLTRNKLMDVCKRFYCRGLDSGLDIDCETWSIEDGICASCIQHICKTYDISHYAFDAMSKCFIKYVSKNQNHKALFYFSINNHMYLVKDEVCKKSLCELAKTKTLLNVNTSLLEAKMTNNLMKFPIYENIDVLDVVNYESCNIIYSRDGKHNINDIYDRFIEIYNIIPTASKTMSINTNIQYFEVKLNGNKYYFRNDNNDVKLGFDWKLIQGLCAKHEIEFKNQTFITFVKQLRSKMFDEENKRVDISDDIIKLVYEKCNNTCMDCKKSKSKFDIDHIRPLSNGGNSEIENLQLLCKSCHKKKCEHEKDQGDYIKIIDSESSYNTKIKTIMESDLSKSYAFIERVGKASKNSKYFHIDIKKCRRNILYFGEYDYPVFTVMDDVVNYTGQSGPGVYYIESNNYLPMRGNGWYYYNMVDFCLKNNIIQPSDIKYTIQASLSIPKDKYNKFIDYCIENFTDKEAKFAINSMIGAFAINTNKQNIQTLVHVTTSPFEAFKYYYKYNGSFVDTHDIGKLTYYSVSKSEVSMKLETESPIYSQIVQQEAILLYELTQLVKSKGGKVLDLNTDAVCCEFPGDILPSGILDFNYANGSPMYQLEDKDRLKVPKMEKFNRRETFTNYAATWVTYNDVIDNDFTPLVDLVLNSNSSFNIDGPAGCGKSTLIKMLQKEMDERKISYFTTAPTNKACNIVNGLTLHRFMSKIRGKATLKNMKIDYIFVDEISMVKEIFYKFLLMIKKLKIDTKVILCGDFRQLAPVLDRVDADYKNSVALHELCDGNKLQLTKCRRADSELYEICKEENIYNITKEDFSNVQCDFNVSFTNVKRKEINNHIMRKKYTTSKPKVNKFFKIAKSKYDDNSQDVILMKNTPLISNKTNTKMKLIKNELYVIKSIENHIVKLASGQTFFIVDSNRECIKENKISAETFQSLFYVAYCITTHKSQGSTFDFPYTIHEWDRMDDTLKYVALSRATKKELINII